MAEAPGISAGCLAVSAVVLCRNEAANLPRCLGALRACDEIIVVDDGSTDGSPEIAAAAGARVLSHPLKSFADQRNWAMAAGALRQPWALHLDADEVVTAELVAELRERLPALRPEQVGFFARKILLDERWLRRSTDYPVYVARLVHRDGPRFEMIGHGEVVVAPPERAVYFGAPMLHYPFSRGWEDWRARHRRYAAAEAARIEAGRAACRWSDLAARDPVLRRRAWRAASWRLPGRPLLRFLYMYVLRAGFLDGRPGWTFCRAMAWYETEIDRARRRLRRGPVAS